MRRSCIAARSKLEGATRVGSPASHCVTAGAMKESPRSPLKFLFQEYFIPADIKGVFTSYRFETRQVDTVWTRLEPNPNTQLEWELMFAMGRVEIRFVTE